MVNAKRGNNFGIEDTYTVEIPIEDLANGATPPAAVTVAPYRGYAYTIGDDSYFQAPVPKDWEYSAGGTAIDIVIRWGCNETYAANSGEVRWQAIYDTVDQNNQIVGVGTTATINSGDVNLPTLARQIEETTLATGIIAANLARVDTIGVVLSRVALGAGANPVQEPEIYAVWLEYTRLISYNTRN